MLSTNQRSRPVRPVRHVRHVLPGLILSVVFGTTMPVVLPAQPTVAGALPATVHQPPATPITIGDAARLAAVQATPVAVAQLQVLQAEARARQSRSALLPNLQAVAAQNGRSFNTATLGIEFPPTPGNPPLFDPDGQVIGPVNTTDIRGRLATPLVDFAALGRYRGARASAAAAGVEVTGAEQLAAWKAATAYVRLQHALAQLTARAADSSLAAELLGVARDQLTAGVGVRLDVTRAESQVAATRAQLLVARNERDRAELELRRTLDLPLDTHLIPADQLRVPSMAMLPEQQDAVNQALHGRPELKLLDAQLVAARHLITATHAGRLPSVSLFVDDGIIGKSVAHMLNTYTWGIQLTVPVFEGFRRNGEIDEQEARFHELQLRRHDMEQQVTAEVQAALLDLSSASELSEAAQERLRLAEQEVEQAGERFHAGISGNADVIAASLSLTGARTQVNDALTSYQMARVALAYAQGDVTALP